MGVDGPVLALLGSPEAVVTPLDGDEPIEQFVGRSLPRISAVGHQLDDGQGDRVGLERLIEQLQRSQPSIGCA